MGQANLPVGRVETDRGTLFLRSDRDFTGCERPMVLVVHGALRHSMNTQVWLPHLTDRYDVVLLDLPGHGYTPSDCAPDIGAFATRVGAFVRKYCGRHGCVILGESIGGLIGLALADGRIPAIKGLVAADPPMTTSKQWGVQNNLLQPSGEVSEFLRALYANTFGLVDETVVRERIYYSLVAKVRVPTLILTGDLPLFPVRPLPNLVPCVLDAVDMAVIRAFGNTHVSIEVIEGSGHLCMDPSIDQARAMVLDFCQARLGKGAAPTTPAQTRADLLTGAEPTVS